MKRFAMMLGSASALALACGALAHAGVIQGRVTEASGTVGLEGALIRVVETGQSVVAGRDGSFRLPNVPAGTYTLSFTYSGAETQTQTVTLASASDVASAEVRLGSDVQVMDNILVIGQRGAFNSALSRQRAADGVETILSADAVGQLPDENVAEAVRRVPGVNIQNDQGEGRFVSIRGISPNQVATSVNGVRLTSPEAGSRAVGLDVIDADILAGIVINKTLSADMDADTLGGRVDIETLSGLDQDDRLFRVKVDGIYSELAEDYGHRGSVVFADNFLDGRLGVALSASYQKREFGSDNVEVDGPEYENEDGVIFPSELELRDYVITRERTSVSLNLDYQLSENTRLFLNSMYSDFSDQEYRNRIENKFGKGEYNEDQSSTSRAVVEGTSDDEFEVDRDMKDRLETQEMYTIATGFETFAGNWTLDGTLSFVHAEEAEPNRIDTGFRAKHETGFYGVDMSDPMRPRMAITDATGRDNYFDLSNYEFDDLEFLNGLSEDDELAAQFNVRYDLNFGVHPGYIQSGARYRQREKSYNATVQVFDGYDGADLTADQFSGRVDFPLDDFGLGLNPRSIRDHFFANRANYEEAEIDSLVASNSADYSFDEDVFAGYIMAGVDIDNLHLVGGLRFEKTEYDASAKGVFLAEEDATVGGVVLGEDTVLVTDIVAKNDYSDVLPSVSAKLDLSEDVVLRAGYYASFGRPEAEQVAPRVYIEQNDEDEIEAEFGNPLLDRQKAHNFDVMGEWYFADEAVFSVGFFHKRIDDYIAKISVSDVEVNGVTIEDGTTYTNLARADLTGFEFNYQQALNFLPGALDGIIVGVNYTYVNSTSSVEDSKGNRRSITIPGQSDHVANAIVGYDKGPFDIRLAAAYRSDYLDEIGAGEIGKSKGMDRMIDDHLQLDFSAKYKITDNFRVRLEVKNITDEPYQAYIKHDGVRYNSQYEEYGRSVVFGLQYRY
ncbi:TonB-dependent receptor [Woodsholea maritima]|uniref:TonB-dependent receptor n=1 Tax=Woodsholea maritima TaxID=240237 RepID=UPI0003797358|nr:TonB-dependent receptor [Woodsholea maritima]